MTKPTTDTLDAVRARLRAARATVPPTPWRVIAADYRPVPAGTLARIAYDASYEPRRLDYRRALGLSDEPMARVRVRVCADCGLPHYRETACPERRRAAPPRPRRDWRGLARLLAGVIVNAEWG